MGGIGHIATEHYSLEIQYVYIYIYVSLPLSFFLFFLSLSLSLSLYLLHCRSVFSTACFFVNGAAWGWVWAPCVVVFSGWGVEGGGHVKQDRPIHRIDILMLLGAVEVRVWLPLLIGKSLFLIWQPVSSCNCTCAQYWISLKETISYNLREFSGAPWNPDN